MSRAKGGEDVEGLSGLQRAGVVAMGVVANAAILTWYGAPVTHAEDCIPGQECKYAGECYSDGACTRCQRCTCYPTYCTWRDDTTCPFCYWAE